ncbi:MAG: UbiX family flavin prenyltransferase [Thermoanaerobaculia bacterium]|nr:UbiX family flavin prenyltransferase [Thermoanaerobaculia bacterium]MBP9825020.1 UbiX family flavin prenyltransferase [Thermoanaerobaculia bacterium]
MKIALLVSGASGMLLPRHLLGALTRRTDVSRLHLVVSKGASQVLFHELGRDRTGAEALVESAALPESARAKVVVHRDNELDAPISSGSYRLAGTLVLPCSSGTLGALATGSATTLLHRAGAVALKERWPLVLGFRETPLNLVHVENLRTMVWAGAIVAPPIPAFYLGGETPEQFLDAYALRLMDHLGLPGGDEELRWHGGERGARGAGGPG